MYKPESLSLFEEAMTRVLVFEELIVDIIKTDPVYELAFHPGHYEGFRDDSDDYRCTVHRLPMYGICLMLHYNEETGPEQWEPQYVRIYGSLLERILRALERRWRDHVQT